jgi:hypothetical protein
MFTFIIFNLKAEKESSTRKDRAVKDRRFSFRICYIYPLRVFRFNRKKSTLQRHNTENSKQIFPGKDLRAPVPIFRKFAVIFAKKCLSGVSTTPAIKEKNFGVHIFHILLRACLSALSILRLNLYLFFIFGSIGKLVLSALTPTKSGVDDINARLSLTPAKILDFLVISDQYQQQRGKINCGDDRGMFFLQNCKLHSKKGQQYLWPQGSDTAADGVIGTTMKGRIHRHLANPNQRPLRPLRLPKPKSALSPATKINTADNNAIGTAMKRCIHRHLTPTLIRDPRGRQNYFKPKTMLSQAT